VPRWPGTGATVADGPESRNQSFEQLRQRITELEAALRVYREAYAAVLAHAEGLRMDTPEDERVRLKLVQLLHEVAALAGDGGGA
jgi:hypothetical protein